jgi:hypothetical protein
MSTHADLALPRRARTAALVAGALIAAVFALPTPAAAATPPTTPGTLVVTNVTATSATLTWGASTDPLGIVGYQVYRQAGTGANALIATTDGTVTHYNATHLYGSTQYAFQVAALDVAAQTSAPTSAGFTTSASTATTAPLPPSSSSVAAHPFSDSRIDLVWGASTSTDVSGYVVLRDGSPVAQVDLPGGLHYSDNNLAPSSTHTYTVEALDSAGTASTPTAGRTATTLAAGTVQVARGPYVSNVTATTAIVSWWTNVSSPGEVDYGTTGPTTVVSDATSSLRHQVTLTGLAAGTAYTYTVGTSSVRSAPASFRTAAAPGTSFSFAAIGDFGGASTGETQNGANIATAGTSFIQTLGDNVYPSAGPPDPDFATTYSDFDARLFKQFGPALRNQAFFPANGNQEYYAQGAFWSAFPMPGTNHSWYSYDWGNAHISVLDTQLSFAPASAQYTWLQSDLAAHQGATWRIVVLQDPPYSSTSATSGSKPVRQDLVPLFQQENVALVLSGNSHNYERSVPLTDGNPAAGGITYIVSGGGGNGHNTFTTTAPPWSAARDDVRYEFAKVTVTPSALTVDAIDAATNTVFDTTTIQKPSAVPGAPTIGTASLAGPTSATVSWTAPADNGGSPITGYDVAASPAGPTCSTTGATSCTVTNLTSGTSYTFTVVARNAVGAGPASGASNAVTPLVATTLVIDGAPSTALAGSKISLTGKLTRSDTSAPIANRSIELRYRPAGSTGSFSTFGTTATSTSTGAVVFNNVVLSRSTQYVFSMAAGGGYSAATSPGRTVAATRGITITASPNSVKLGAAFTITGKVSPSSPGVTILLQRRIGTSWSTSASKPLSSTSTYSFGIKAPSRGTLAYRTVVRADASYAWSASPTASVTVK